MKYISTDANLSLEIEGSLLNELYLHGLSKYPNEFGGILVGRYASDRRTAYIEKTILPERYQASKYYFERGSEGLKESLEKCYEDNPKLFYVGEWHTHPDGPPTPSARDKSTMRHLESDESVYINYPILLILGISKTGFEAGFFIQYNNQLLAYEAEK